MNKFNTANLNIIAVYYFYIKNEIVYIGRTSNLKDRLYGHFNPNAADFQDWKLTVDNIKYIECKTNTDSDILETYFINKYKPIYNRDKLYVDECSFELVHSELQEIDKILINDTDCELIIDIKLNKKINFKKLCISYIDARTNNNIVLCNLMDINYPLIKQAYEELGTDKMKSLNYRKNWIEEELLVNSVLNDSQKIVNLLGLKVGELIDKSVAKLKLQSIYDQLGIKKTAKATDLTNWYSIKNCEKTINGKREKLFKVVTINIK